VRPGKYAVPGGKLEWGDLDVSHPTRLNGDVLDYQDAVEKLLALETKEELGETIKILQTKKEGAIASSLFIQTSFSCRKNDSVPASLPLKSGFSGSRGSCSFHRRNELYADLAAAGISSSFWYASAL